MEPTGVHVWRSETGEAVATRAGGSEVLEAGVGTGAAEAAVGVKVRGGLAVQIWCRLDSPMEYLAFPGGALFPDRGKRGEEVGDLAEVADGVPAQLVGDGDGQRAVVRPVAALVRGDDVG